MNSNDADEKDFSEFLKDYKEMKKEQEQEKKEDKKKEEKIEKIEKKKRAVGFNRKFRKLNGIEYYDRKNRKNFLLESVKFYMNKK